MCCEHGCSHEASYLMSVPVFKGLNEVDRQILQKVTRSRSFSKGEFISKQSC